MPDSVADVEEEEAVSVPDALSLPLAELAESEPTLAVPDGVSEEGFTVVGKEERRDQSRLEVAFRGQCSMNLLSSPVLVPSVRVVTASATLTPTCPSSPRSPYEYAETASSARFFKKSMNRLTRSFLEGVVVAVASAPVAGVHHTVTEGVHQSVVDVGDGVALGSVARESED